MPYKRKASQWSRFLMQRLQSCRFDLLSHDEEKGKEGTKEGTKEKEKGGRVDARDDVLTK